MEHKECAQRTHRELAAVANRQYGAFTRKQAFAAGFSRRAIGYRLRTAQWLPIDFGVYREATTPGSWHQRLLAACLAGPAFASHRAAARLSGLLDPAPVEVAALRHRRRRSADVIWHESQALFDNDVTEIEGIPTTRPTRTVIDLALVLGDTEYARVYDEAVRRRLVPQIAAPLRIV